jgi:hypothetical protein
MQLDTEFDKTVYGIFFFRKEKLIHSGTKLYKIKDGEKTVLFHGVNEAPSNSFVYEDTWYFKDGKHYLQYDGSEIKSVVGYVPTTSIGRKPQGGGTIFEDVNMLSYRRKNSFVADGTSVDFYLDAQNIDTDFTPIVKVNDKEVTNFTTYHAEGRIEFTSAPAAPLTDGQDNVVIEFQKTTEDVSNKILNCTLLQVFDNRVFFSGNKDYPNFVWHCSLDDPSYCSDLDYYKEGLDAAPVRGLVAGNNALWVFREPSDANTTVFYHTPTIDAEYGKIYPSQHSSVTAGCIGKAINFNDDIVFFSDRGMEGISGDITTEQVLAHRSTLVDRKMLSEADYRDMLLEEWEGYLCVFIGDKAYLADSRAMFQNENHFEYEWFYFDLGTRITCTKVKDGVLYLGTENGVYTLTDNDCDVESYWTTPLDKFDAPDKLKTSNKRGCVVESTGMDIQVFVKTNKEDWSHIGTFNDVADAFVARIKKKKFKDLQLKFYSSKRFSLETATFQVFVGGYVKRI